MKAKRCITIIIYRPHIDEGWFWRGGTGREWYVGLPFIGITIHYSYR